VRGRLLNEIPGARIVRVFVGAPRTWLERIEPQYEVPTGKRYRIELTAGGRARAREASSAATVTVLEPGFLAAARSMPVAPGQRTRLRLSADGHRLTFARPRGRRKPMLVLGNAAPDSDDYQWNIRDKDRSTGRPTSGSIDVTRRNMRLTGRGSHQLTMYAVGNAVSVFTNDRLRLRARVTAILDYGDWTEGEPMPVTLVKDGRVIRRLLLPDQPSSDTGSQFIPNEANPSPTGPQPSPVAPATPTRPDTTIDRSPSVSSNSASGSFEFSGSGAAGFECSLDAAGFAPCTSPRSFSSLADGRHTFAVRAIDPAGNVDDTPAQFSWVVDATAPALAPAISPSPTYLGAAATATPNATDGGTGVASQSCGSVSTSSVGDHSVDCTATDRAGNTTDVTVHYTVTYRILGFFPPAPNSKWKPGQTVPIKVALADAAGVRIPDATAAALVGNPCTVKFSASGVQAQSPTCMRYDPTCDQFIYNWKLGDTVGDVTLEVRVDHGTGTPASLSRTITISN
jgi:hypothetical protein